MRRLPRAAEKGSWYKSVESLVSGGFSSRCFGEGMVGDGGESRQALVSQRVHWTSISWVVFNQNLGWSGPPGL